MEANYQTYKYEKGMEKYSIQLFYGQADCLIDSKLSRLISKEADKNYSIMSIDLVIKRPWKGTI